jgi:hypothetical protein
VGSRVFFHFLEYISEPIHPRLKNVNRDALKRPRMIKVP